MQNNLFIKYLKVLFIVSRLKKAKKKVAQIKNKNT